MKRKMTGWYRRRVGKAEGTAQADSGGDDKENWLGEEEEEMRRGMRNAKKKKRRREENKVGKREGDWKRNKRRGEHRKE